MEIACHSKDLFIVDHPTVQTASEDNNELKLSNCQTVFICNAGEM